MSRPHPRQHYNVTLAILVFAGIAFALQQTMIIPALPVLKEEFDTSTAWATWLLTGFLLSASVATPLLGKLGDQHGKERLLVISLSVFLSAPRRGARPEHRLADRRPRRPGRRGRRLPAQLRDHQGRVPPEKVGPAVGAVSAVFAVGGGLGLVLSGLLIDHLSWRWIFWVGAVFVAVAVVLVYLFVPESPIKTPSRLDIPGALLLSGGLVALLLALTEGDRWGWGSARILALFLAAAVLLSLWVVVELRVAEPMVDMRMLANRPVLFTNLTALIAGFALFGSFILVPTLLQLPPEVAAYGFGATATVTGLYLLPSSLTGFVSGPMGGRDEPPHVGEVAAQPRDGARRRRPRDARDPALRAVAHHGRDAGARRRPPDDVRGDGEDHRRRGAPLRDRRGHGHEHRHADDRRRRRRPGRGRAAHGGHARLRRSGGVGFITAFAVGAFSSFVAAGVALLITPRVRAEPVVA